MISILRDIKDITSNLAELSGMSKERLSSEMSKRMELYGNTRGKSLNARAKDSILQFPILTSNTLSKENLDTIAKALEVTYADYIKLVVSRADLINVTDNNAGKAKEEFLNKIHQNDSLRFNSLGNSANGIGIGKPIKLESTLLESTKRMLFEEINKECKRMLGSYSENFNLELLSEYPTLNEASGKFATAKRPTKNNNELKTGSGTNIRTGNSDAKKLNELQPTILQLELSYKIGQNTHKTELIIGIKCITHIMDTNQIRYYVPKSIKEKRVLFRFIQWTTGEIKFFRDFVLDLDKIKFEATAKSDSTVRWWRYLKNRGSVNRMKSMLTGSAPFIPNATFVLSYDEVEHIKQNDGIDLLNDVVSAKHFMNTYFLMNLVVMDESSDVAYFFDDVKLMWERYSFNALKEKGKDSGNNIKEIIKAMTMLK